MDNDYFLLIGASIFIYKNFKSYHSIDYIKSKNQKANQGSTLHIEKNQSSGTLELLYKVLWNLISKFSGILQAG